VALQNVFLLRVMHEKQRDLAMKLVVQIHLVLWFIVLFFAGLAEVIHILFCVIHLLLPKFLLEDFLNKEKNISDFILRYFYELYQIFILHSAFLILNWKFLFQNFLCLCLLLQENIIDSKQILLLH
jgi:SNF family Na+-dependent transporter